MSFIALIKSLGLNIALLISLTAIYRYTLSHSNTLKNHQLSVINGCLFGTVGVVGMLVPVHVMPGVILDGRVVVVALAGAFTGGLSALVAAIPVSLYRLYVGGIGAWPGVGAVVVGAVAGTLFYRQYRQSIKITNLIVLGVVLALQGLLWVFALPTNLQMTSFLKFWFPVGIAYPAGTVFLGLLLIREKRQHTLEQTLQENEKRLATQLSEQEALLNISHAILEMKQPGDLKVFAQTLLATLRSLNVNAQSIAIHRVQDISTGLVHSLRIVQDEVITDLTPHQAEPDFIEVWETKIARYRANVKKTHPEDFKGIQERFKGLPILSYVDTPFQQGILCMHSIHADAFSENDIALLKKIATMLSVGMARIEDLENVEQRTQELEIEISERKRVEQELVRSQRLRAVGELSAGISHNLNNILTGILGPAMLLEIMELSDEAREEVTHILNAGNRAKDLVRRLHLTTRGAQLDTPQAVDVNTIIKEAILITQPRWKDETESKGQRITLNQNINPVPPVKGTPAGLLDLMINFLFNAIDALPHGGEINISTKQMNSKVWITIQDTGIGMDVETQKRIFEPFFTTKANIGTGLGLATAYNTIEKWGGTVDVTSQPERGTTFVVKLEPWQEETPTTN